MGTKRLPEDSAADNAALNEADREFDRLHEQFRQRKQAAEAAQLEARRAHRFSIRKKLLNLDLPDHFLECRTCGRAILTLNHEAACKTGKSYVNLIRP